MVLIELTSLNQFIIYAQEDVNSILSRVEAEDEFNQNLQLTSQLIVMLRIEYEETPEFGAGIVIGREKDRLLIATAYHLIHRDALQPQKVLVKFKTSLLSSMMRG
jgi:hypothetical protein